MNYDPDNAGHRAALALDIKATLAGLGFQQVDVPGAKEAVFARNSTRLPRVQIRIYTSIVGSEVRQVGGDSIKVCSVYTNSEGRPCGVTKEQRVFRTGQLEEIPGRIKDRIKSVAADLNAAQICSCGAPKLLSKAGKLYCGARCWTR